MGLFAGALTAGKLLKTAWNGFKAWDNAKGGHLRKMAVNALHGASKSLIDGFGGDNKEHWHKIADNLHGKAMASIDKDVHNTKSAKANQPKDSNNSAPNVVSSGSKALPAGL